MTGVGMDATSAAFWIVLVITFYVGYSLGCARTKYRLAWSCRKLGGFFVGSDVFKCDEIARKDRCCITTVPRGGYQPRDIPAPPHRNPNKPSNPNKRRRNCSE